MQCSRLAACGLIAIATAVPLAAADELAQEHVTNPTQMRAGADVLNQDPAIILRSFTRGMPRGGMLVGQAHREQVSLAVPHRGSFSTSTEGDSARNRPNIVIDLLVAYTKKAASHYGDIGHDLVGLAVEEANRSFRLSDLGHIRLRIVHAYQTDYVEEGEHFDHVWRFADKGDGYMDEVHGLRDLYRADVALLIVDDAKGCGLATRVNADADEAFAVVHHECAAANYTVAHEIGHLMGARHELGYVNGTKWRDIMSYKDSCGGCPRLPVWSSPTVLVNGEPAGTIELDNARIIAQQAARVAAFR
jgi:metallopeptidase family M12-like protein